MTTSSLRQELQSKNLEELRALAGERNIEGRSEMNRTELITALEKDLLARPPRIG